MFIFWLSPNKKKKIYTVLEFTKLEYCVNFFFFFKKRYSSLVYLSTVKMVLESTKLEYHKIFLMRNSSFWNSSSRKSGTLPFISETVFFCLKFPKIVVLGHFGLHPPVRYFQMLKLEFAVLASSLLQFFFSPSLSLIFSFFLSWKSFTILLF